MAYCPYDINSYQSNQHVGFIKEQRIMKIAAIQASPVFLDPEGTTKKAISLMREAAAHGAELCVFPEVFISGKTHSSAPCAAASRIKEIAFFVVPSGSKKTGEACIAAIFMILCSLIKPTC